jgi:hypothetical protein
LSKVLEKPYRVDLEDASHAAFLTMSVSFPDVQGGGSLILAWQIKGKNVLVVGGGEV